jgi:hypothetical protein
MLKNINCGGNFWSIEGFMNKLLTKTRRMALGVAILSILVAGTTLLYPAHAAGITNMSVSGTGISNNASSTSAMITPAITFRLATALANTSTITITLNGMVTSASVASADLTASGACSGTASFTTVNPGTSNPSFAITGLTCGNGSNGTLTFAASRFTATSSAGNYSINITSPGDTGSFLYYVGSSNQVTINGTVDSSISLAIRNTADTADLAMVSGGAVGPHVCPLDGNPSTAGTVDSFNTSQVANCSYRIKVGTNASNGYTVTYQSGSAFTNGSYSLPDAAATTGTTMAANTENYGAVLAAGSVTGAGGSTSRGAVFGSNASLAYKITDTSATTLYTSNKQNAPATSGDTTNTALVTHQAAINSGTPAGVYSHTVTYTVSASF